MSNTAPPSNTDPHSTLSTKPDEQASRIVQEVFNASISFFGKVQDQKGAPISGAKVDFGAVDKFWEPGSNYRAISDTNGLFSISGIRGAGLTVGVSKQGYDGLKGLSYQSFGYGMPPDSNRKAPPTRDEPALFVLRKKASAEPIIAVRRDVLVPKDGTPVEVSLTTGKPVAEGRGDLRIECWTLDQKMNAQGRYDWRVRLSVPSGGIVERRDTQMEFTAPENGYLPSFEMTMPQSSTTWRHDHDAQYWLHLRNGTFARMRFRITTAGAHFLSVESYLNPSGSRNLELDENKAVK